MKRAGSSRSFPTGPAEIEAAIARAPGKDRPLTAKEEAAWNKGVLVNGGGYTAVRKALAARRKPGQRGPQLAPTKTLVSVRYSPEVIAFFKAGGAGWQARMDDALKQWVAKHDKPGRTGRPREV
jgi:uncharacterized protein (DUF4415 family)